MAAEYGAAVDGQTERESQTVKLHRQNNQSSIEVVYFDARLDARLGPLGSQLVARWFDPKHREPNGQYGQSGVFGWSYVSLG